MPQISHHLNWPDASTKWSAAINPVLANILLQGNAINGVKLINGATVINHGLGRMPIGFIITDLNANSTIYRSQPFTTTTLTLTSSAAATVNIWIF